MAPSSTNTKYLHVVAATIVDGRGNVLIARRPDHVHQGGRWEFPGGKLESNESQADGLRRELHEELGIEITQYRPRITVPYVYPDRSVYLDVWHVDAYVGDLHGREGQEVRWVSIATLQDYTFPAANLPIVRSLQLPDLYLITPEPGQPDVWPRFLELLEFNLQNGIRLVQLRSKFLSGNELYNIAVACGELCHRYGARLLLNTEAIEIIPPCADGWHLTSRALMSLQQRPEHYTGLLAASCHNECELLHACNIGVDFAVLSPVRSTKSHPDTPPLGWESFAALAMMSSIPVYALGGVGVTDVALSWWHGGQGIAAISGLWMEPQ